MDVCGGNQCMIGMAQVHLPCPAGAVWFEEGAGRLAVLGSAQIFDDKWIDKEDNSKIMDFLFRWLKPESKMKLDMQDADEPIIGDIKHLPDVESLADRPKCCLQVGLKFLCFL